MSETSNRTAPCWGVEPVRESPRLRMVERDGPAPRPSPIRVCVMRSGEVISAGIHELFNRFPGRFEPVSPVGATSASVDVVLLDRVSVSAETVTDGWAARLEAPRVVLVSRPSPPSARAAAPAHVVEVLVTASYAELVQALETAYLMRRSSALVARNASRRAWPVDADLSFREAQVVDLICNGRTNVEIAQELFLSINSIKTYIRTAYRKIGVQSRTQVLLWRLQQDQATFAERVAPRLQS